jgi:hypothetical protein
MSRLQKSIAMHLKPPMNDLSEKMLLDLVRSTGLAGGIKKRRRFFAELDDSPRHRALVRRVVGPRYQADSSPLENRPIIPASHVPGLIVGKPAAAGHTSTGWVEFKVRNPGPETNSSFNRT